MHYSIIKIKAFYSSSIGNTISDFGGVKIRGLVGE
jgi:hypothetical protein